MAGRRPLTWTRAIAGFITDKTSYGDFSSKATERAYRDTLELHAEDALVPPTHTGPNDVKRTLARWTNPNSKRTKRAHLQSFYDWLVEVGARESNPVRQTRRIRTRPAVVTRWTLDEAR